ncbi:DUF1697 domain-containing protein [Polaromonas sp.]|nr:DUF1697 domain-containing protein [Candidatus Saccharibacteria bacterium]
MKYVALLRGINVGGNAKVEMPRLKKVFESVGCTAVSTYINSGNVVFDDNRPRDMLTERIEDAIAKEFGMDIKIVLRDEASIQAICRISPASWTNDSNQKTDVLFLWEEIDDPSIIDRVVINPDIENVRYAGGALVWNIGRENATRGGGVKLIKTDMYKLMTVRNINTVRKLQELMEQGVPSD